jgi:hypothetical protein
VRLPPGEPYEGNQGAGKEKSMKVQSLLMAGALSAFANCGVLAQAQKTCSRYQTYTRDGNSNAQKGSYWRCDDVCGNSRTRRRRR